MQVRIEDVSPVEKKLIVEVPWDSVSDKLGASYRELAKSVQLKGFRKGKVPRSVLERMFGKRVRAEVAGQLVRESFLTAVTEHQLEAVSEPRVDSELEISKGEPLCFEAIVEVKGEVEVESYDGMELTRRPLEVTDAEIDQAVEELQREHTELHPIEDREKLGPGDVIAFSVQGTIGEHEVDRPQMTMDLGDTEHEPLPGLAEAMRGVAVDAQDHQVELAIPEDHEDENIAGKTASLTLNILEARVKDVPELDDEFAKDTGKGETMAELREAVRAEIASKKEEQIREETREQALKELVERNQIPVASSLIERAVQNKFRRLQMMMGMQPHEHDHPIDDELREKLGEGAADEVRGQLLLEAVAEKEGIEVSDEEIDARVGEMAARSGQQLGRLKAEMDRDGRLDNVRFQIRQEKTLDLLISRASVTEAEPEPEPEADAGTKDADEASESTDE